MIYEFTHNAAQQQAGRSGVEWMDDQRLIVDRKREHQREMTHIWPFKEYQHHRRQGTNIPL
jgi:hypothetical protein